MSQEISLQRASTPPVQTKGSTATTAAISMASPQDETSLNSPPEIIKADSTKVTSPKSQDASQPQTSSKSTENKKDVTILPTNTKGLHTVFIHKLYNMLEDDDLKHLIWWSSSNESFMITPGEEFSKALAQYFKHTNVASFIRQLNMYGFHKVSDSSNSSNTNNNSTDPNSNVEPSSEVTVWEFRHSSGNFRKGDVDSLKSIKRRSSKHTSSRNTHNIHGLDPSSDNEFGSERNSSVTDLASLNGFETGNTSNPLNPNSMDPILNVRLAELGHNLAALRHEHARLQLRYDTAIDDLRKTNLDMVYLLDLVQKLIRSQPSNSKQISGEDNSSTFTSPKPHQIITQAKIEEDIASPGSKPTTSSSNNKQSNYSLQEVESDIARFRASILQRAASKDFDQFSVSFAPSYQLHQGPKPSTSAPIQTQNHVQVQQQSVFHHQPISQANVTPHSQHPQPPQSDPSGPVPYPYPYPYPYPQQQQQQQPQQPSQRPQQSYTPTQYHPQLHIQHQQQQQQQQLVQDPFHNDRKSSASSTRTRNMSVLYDPLQPSNNGGIISPATTIHKGSLSGGPPSNPDSTVASPMVPNGSYFPEYSGYPPTSRTHSPDQPLMLQHKQQVSRDQRPGSFPALIPGIQKGHEGFIRKRHSSNDAIEYQRPSPNENTAPNINDPPRSIPRSNIDEPHQPIPRKSFSANNLPAVNRRQSISPSSFETNGGKPVNNAANSGVYALLNPSHERAGPAQKKIKK